MKNFEVIYTQLLRQFRKCKKQPSFFDVIEIARCITDNFKNGGKTEPSPEVCVHYCTNKKELENAQKRTETEYEEVKKYNNMEIYIFSNWSDNRVDVIYFPVSL